MGRAVALIGHVYTDLSACRWGRWGGRWPSSVMYILTGVHVGGGGGAGGGPYWSCIY